MVILAFPYCCYYIHLTFQNNSIRIICEIIMMIIMKRVRYRIK